MTLILGKYGQLAQALRERKSDLVALDRHEAPFTDPGHLIQSLNDLKPKTIINAAAYTAVDKAESEKELALQINAKAVGDIANWCSRNHATLIHFSTDYVFSGEGRQPWTETDQPDPVNWYGYTKWEGEKLIRQSGCSHYNFRVSWLYSPWGSNFVKTIEKLAQERSELKVVSDQWGAPTDAREVAKTIINLLDQLSSKEVKPEYGTYHLRYEPYTNWYDFALKVVENAKVKGLPLKVEKIHPISTEEFPTPAVRPKNSRLGTNFPGLFE